MSNNITPAIRKINGLPSESISPAAFEFTMRRDVLTEMRDGTLLAMDILHPNVDGPCPVVLLRTPYNKVNHHKKALPQDLARRGYIVALQDVRGRSNSDGALDPYRNEHDDGFDTIEWIASQGWCDGNVGMIGGSYEGQTQWFAASHAPAALKAIVPEVSPPGHPFMNEPFYGGAFVHILAEWMFLMGRRSFQLASIADVMSKHQTYFDILPLSKMEEDTGTNSPWWKEWLNHPYFDSYWQERGYEQYWSKMKVPALNMTGWWDLNFLGAPRNFVGMRANAATEEARCGQQLIIGPWPHLINKFRCLNGLDFGPAAIVDVNKYIVRFFDYWLRNVRHNGLEDDARVQIFIIGANEWWAADDWPLPGTEMVPLYLHSIGHANSHRGDGQLAWSPSDTGGFDEYEADPLDPVFSSWAKYDGPVDDRLLSERPDVLCYTTEILDEPLNVVGPVRAVLYASSSCKDCDWHVRLVDVHPDGTARFLCHGVLRARFRHGFDKPSNLKPNEIERFEVDMTATGVQFLPGHRIRVEISSSWFSRFDRNLQTGAANWMTDKGEPVVGIQRIYHQENLASHILLPLVSAPPETPDV